MGRPTNQVASAIGRFSDKCHRVLRSLRIRLGAIARGSIISPAALVNVETGASIRIGCGVRVRPDAIINVVENGVLTVEEGAWIGPGTVIYCAERITIGAHSRIAHYVSIIDHDYGFRDRNMFDATRTKAPIEIGREVWLGASAIIMKGTQIGEGSVVAAGTVVTKAIPPHSVAHNPRPLVVRPIATSDANPPNSDK